MQSESKRHGDYPQTTIREMECPDSLKRKNQSVKTLASHAAVARWVERQERKINEEHPTFQDAGHTYCHEMLESKPSQLIAFNRIDRIATHPNMQKRLDKITLQDIHAFKQTRLNEVTKTTCRDELMMIRRIFRWYIPEYHARTGNQMPNPCDHIVIPPANKTRDRVVTRDELKRLLGAMTSEMAVIVELAYETAMRRSEILKLTADDLYLESRFLRVVEGKEGSRGRTPHEKSCRAA